MNPKTDHGRTRLLLQRDNLQRPRMVKGRNYDQTAKSKTRPSHSAQTRLDKAQHAAIPPRNKL